MRRILLGLTGSVATVLYEKMIAEFQQHFIVDVILTEKSSHFFNASTLATLIASNGGCVYTDESEWKWTKNDFDFTDKWNKNDNVLHISLRDNASALVIAPCSANTLAKITNGICDNLLTSVARAWDRNRPFVIAPAMNTQMWEHPLTMEQLNKFKEFSKNNLVVLPQHKMLACKTKGMGALQDISIIVNTVVKKLQWNFPLRDEFFDKGSQNCSGIPCPGHAGAFLTKRKHHVHTGVDLYTNDGQSVYAVEDGTVVGMEDFTGKSQQTPWWEDTKCILIEGATGVVCYGEIKPYCFEIGHKVKRGDEIGYVKRVLPIHKLRRDIDGHSTSMLHMEIYPHGKYTAFEELGENPDDFNILIDPTPFLKNARFAPDKELKGEYKPHT